ncbi:hypothetical protein HD554DRAFT_1788096 [Boletus coccyginus]|nr:hypothetical protein HD554DRAFT_1788096 [Boletus coccyginus]
MCWLHGRVSFCPTDRSRNCCCARSGAVQFGRRPLSDLRGGFELVDHSGAHPTVRPWCGNCYGVTYRSLCSLRVFPYRLNAIEYEGGAFENMILSVAEAHSTNRIAFTTQRVRIWDVAVAGVATDVALHALCRTWGDTNPRDVNIFLTLLRPTRAHNDPNRKQVYTDGSCTHNGKQNAVLGGGIWFGDHHPLN